MDVEMSDAQPKDCTMDTVMINTGTNIVKPKVDNEVQDLSRLNLEDNTNKVSVSHIDQVFNDAVDKKSEINKIEEPVDKSSQDKRYKMIQAMYEQTKKIDKFLSKIGYVNPHIPRGTLAQESLWKGRVAIVLVKAGDKVELLQDLFVLNLKDKYCKPPIDSDSETEFADSNTSTLPQTPKVSEYVESKVVSEDEDRSDVYEDEDEDAGDVCKDKDSSDDDKIDQLLRVIAEDEEEDEDEEDSISSGSDTLSTFPSPEKPSASSKAKVLVFEDFFDFNPIKQERKVIWPYVIVPAEQSCLVTKVLVKEGMKVKPTRPLFFYDELKE